MLKLLTKRFGISPRILRLGCVGIVLLFIIGMALLGVISWNTSLNLWDGMYPSGEYRLYVQTASGMPIDGAILSVFESGTRTPSYAYPIDNHLSERDLISNNQGLVVILHKPQGFEFGGVCHNLFWFYPICSGNSVRYDCELTADGYQTMRFAISDFFSNSRKNPNVGFASVVLDGGQETKVPVYEIIYYLKPMNSP